MAVEVTAMKKSTKIILIVLAVILVVVSAFLIIVSLALRGKVVETSTDIDDYITYTSAVPDGNEDPVIMPKLETLGNITDTDFQYCKRVHFLYELTSYRLAVSYDEEDYEKEKALLDSRYTYYDSPIFDSHAPGHELAVDFAYRGYSFRTVRDESESTLYYPTKMFFVGTNDKAKKIIYIYYYDIDLDYVTDFATFFRKERITVSNKK